MPARSSRPLARVARRRTSAALLIPHSKELPKEGRANPAISTPSPPSILALFSCCLFTRIEYSSKSSREHEDERVYTVPQFVSSSNVLGGPSLVSEGPSIGSESSAADIFAELRLEKGRFIRFAHEATGIELKPSVVAEMLEEYDRPLILPFQFTYSLPSDTSIICIRSSPCYLIQKP